MSTVIEICIISLTWITTWIYTYIGGPKSKTLPTDPQLYTLSRNSLILIIIFYTVSYNNLTPLPIHISSTLNSGVLFFILLNGALLLWTRKALTYLSYEDIVFGKNPTYTSTGPYQYCRHPMYIALTNILIATWLLFPTILGLLTLSSIIFLFRKKARNE